MQFPPSLVILAAGLGSRFGGNKQVAEIPDLGKTIMELTIEDAVQAGIKHCVIVVNQQVRAAIESQILPRITLQIQIQLVEQAITDLPKSYQHLAELRVKPWGTGHALLCAAPYLNDRFIVVTADDYYGPSAFNTLCNNWQLGKWRMLAFALTDTLSARGGVNRGICQVQQGMLLKVQEALNIQRNMAGQLEGTIAGQVQPIRSNTPVSMTCWALEKPFLTRLAENFTQFLGELRPNQQTEYFLPDQIENAIDEGQLVEVLHASDKWFGITYRDDLANFAKFLNENQ